VNGKYDSLVPPLFPKYIWNYSSSPSISSFITPLAEKTHLIATVISISEKLLK
jgi:hypothetical protein